MVFSPRLSLRVWVKLLGRFDLFRKSVLRISRPHGQFLFVDSGLRTTRGCNPLRLASKFRSIQPCLFLAQIGGSPQSHCFREIPRSSVKRFRQPRRQPRLLRAVLRSRPASDSPYHEPSHSHTKRNKRPCNTHAELKVRRKVFQFQISESSAHEPPHGNSQQAVPVDRPKLGQLL